jgi:thiosulfate/3-mercaptopyruvate sulfurtransferase
VSALITPEELLADPAPRTLLDVRWELGRTDGRQQYEAGHVPGAAFVDLDVVLADPPGEAGRHPLPDPVRFAEAMRRCGVRRDLPVVVYDDVGGTSAARAWWLLRYHGHPDVRLLDGGWSWWRRLGGEVEVGDSVPAYGDFEPLPGGLPTVDADEAARVAVQGMLVDARAPERFRGEVEPVDPVAGHVPGAVNVPTACNRVAEGERAGRFRSVDELAREYAAPAGTEVAVYCGSGVTAAHDVLALELLGVRAALYPGSWSHWVTDPARPVARG